MKHIFFVLSFILVLLPILCFASGHNNGLEGLSGVYFVLIAILLIILLNIISALANASPSQKTSSLILTSICLLINLLLLIPAIILFSTGYKEHTRIVKESTAYEKAAVAREGHAESFNKNGGNNELAGFRHKCIIDLTIILLILAAISYDIYVIGIWTIRKRRNNQQEIG